MSVKLKCCGFKELEAVRGLRGQPIDYVGFILAPSKRRVSLNRLTELAKAVPPGIKKTGVWVNPSLSEVIRAIDAARLDAVQLHGQEPPAFCERIKREHSVEVIKTFHVSDETSDVPNEAYGETIDCLLLDTYDPRLAGGTGKAFQWEKIDRYRQWSQAHGVKLFVAGGITPENVDQLLTRYRIDGVDVASGVETDGKKDLRKVKKLAEKVKRHDSSPK